MALAPHPIISLLFHLLLDLLMSLFQDLPVLWRALLAFVLLFLQNISSSSYHRLHPDIPSRPCAPCHKTAIKSCYGVMVPIAVTYAL